MVFKMKFWKINFEDSVLKTRFGNFRNGNLKKLYSEF